MPQMTRHYLTIAGPDGPRRVHYRKCGKGPPVLMVHQSPRSSAEYEALMQDWAGHFTCIAPDTPGFGQSDPLAKADPDINDYADAIVEFVGALGLDRVAAYGFHSGAIILVTALKRHPHVFRCIAAGGYAIWTPQEMAIFGERYIPPFLPSTYGEHLTWMWNRILEQSWFFPWFDVRAQARLSGAHDDPLRTHAIAMEMLDAGDAYRLGYGAVLRASRDIPPPDAITPPVLISAYAGDPLQDHIDRLGAMPAGWEACKVDSPKIHQDISRDFLALHAGPIAKTLKEDDFQGFLHVKTDLFDGLIHWRGVPADTVMVIPAPGRSIDLLDNDAMTMDPPGHGLSDDWISGAPTEWDAWRDVIHRVSWHGSRTSIDYEALPKGDPEQLYPDLAPDRYGAYLTRAWSIVRARHFFEPWYEVCHENACAFDGRHVEPDKLALEHRSLIKASAAKAFHLALSAPKEDDDYANP
jgi:haloalkane dehalogenase